MTQPLIESVLSSSRLLLEALQADELEIESVAVLENERKERIYQLFELLSPEELQAERAELDAIQRLDREIILLLHDKKKCLSQRIIDLKRGKNKAAAYKINQF